MKDISNVYSYTLVILLILNLNVLLAVKSYQIKPWWPGKLRQQLPQSIQFTQGEKYWNILKHLQA